MPSVIAKSIVMKRMMVKSKSVGADHNKLIGSTTGNVQPSIVSSNRFCFDHLCSASQCHSRSIQLLTNVWRFPQSHPSPILLIPRAADGNANINSSYLYPGNPRVATPSQSGSLRRKSLRGTPSRSSMLFVVPEMPGWAWGLAPLRWVPW